MSQKIEAPTPATISRPQGVDSDNPFEEMMSRFDVAAQRPDLDPGLYNDVLEMARNYNVSYRIAAYMLGISRVAHDTRVHGLYA